MAAISTDRINILVVEDDKVVMAFLAVQIRDIGHHLEWTDNGQKALEYLQSHKGEIDVVLMDWRMPVMDGLTAVRRMKEDPNLRDIPIIMLTGADKPEEMKKSLEAGVFYYLTKPVKKTVLQSVIASAGQTARRNQALARELKQHKASFNLIDSCKFKFRTMAEARSLAVFLANCFPDPGRILPGLGELLVNAVEHGNLGIGYERKSELVESGKWAEEIERLENLPENTDKFAIATIARKKDGIYVVIEDQGDGFKWREFVQINPARAGSHHGRGIAQARAASFDRLTYNDKGNQAVAFAAYKDRLEW